MSNALPSVERWILDTHVVLDWLLFDDPRTHFLAAEVPAGTACWLATAAMRREFESVLARDKFSAIPKDRAAILQAWDRWATPADTAAPAPWRCSDPDDQMFIDLAVAAGACALFTRDRALLKLSARARPLGLQICPPERWRPNRGIESAALQGPV